MKITIIGTGNVGSALAEGWFKAEHQITLGVRDLNDFKGKDLLNLQNFEVLEISQAVQNAEVIVLSVPVNALAEVCSHLNNCEDKIIIDPTNSFPSPPADFKNGFEAISALTKCKHIVKAFSNTGYQNMKSPKGLDTFMAGDDAHAKAIAKQLAEDLGFANCHDFGDSTHVALLEQLAFCWIHLAYMQGFGTDIALNLVKR